MFVKFDCSILFPLSGVLLATLCSATTVGAFAAPLDEGGAKIPTPATPALVGAMTVSPPGCGSSCKQE